MTKVIIAKHLTDKGKIAIATSEVKSTVKTEGITSVGIKFKKLLHLIVLL